MSFPRYERYKDSGVEWLGEVPEHWKIRRIRWLCEIKKRIAGELGHDVLSITQDGIKVKDLESNDGQLSMDYSKYQFVEVGDFAMNHMDLLTGYVDLSQMHGVTSPDYRVFSIRNPAISKSKYLLYLFQMGYKNKIFFAYGQGSSQLGRWRLPTEQFKDLPFPLPPTTEQQSIASFLDRETVKIDELIDEQQLLIELLKEKRQAVISHAVTKGLNPDVTMKDSGVEWLGDVPEHWIVGAVKHFFTIRDSQRIPLSSEERSYRQGDFPYYGASGIIDSIDEYIFNETLILVSEDGANLVNRATPIAFVARGRFWVNNHAHILRPVDEFFDYWAQRIEVIDLIPFITGSAQPKLTIEALTNLIISVPPTKDERAHIEQFIVQHDKQTDNLITEAQDTIVLLQERRTAIISAAVTGKIDVRKDLIIKRRSLRE
ncbi:restriction endonuclease subunit S [Nitrosomonas supralitoralis]|uniref:Restriction endonuclease subunit S n=1 Tax=Nitrosomonas supralitoralis TaxID=2116706 RepID=A0A2P7NRY6_9PROT|nr:restriction endonuclease subunit S [Nitrosomonas supralitoralis]PSJ16209.1 restriction endonuclease subunit S [Nitrosomonas supralitoralis]